MTETRAWLTQEAFDRLAEEYAFLVGEGRASLAREIDDCRREGDLNENGGYHAAREEQAKQEGRIAQLRRILDNAVVGEVPSGDGPIEPGMVVTAEVGGRADAVSRGFARGGGGLRTSMCSPPTPRSVRRSSENVRVTRLPTPRQTARRSRSRS